MSLYPFYIMLLLAVSDIVFTFLLNENRFLNPKFGESLPHSVATVVIITAVSYIAGVSITESSSFTVSVVFAAVLSALAFCFTEFVSKHKDENSGRFGKLTSCFNIVWFLMSVLLLAMLSDYSFDNSLQNTEIYIYLAVCVAVALITIIAYSSLKTKVSAFRNGKTLAIIALVSASALFGAVIGTILGACLN